MAKHKESGDYVALKKIRMDSEKDGFPITAVREIKILKSADHENVIRLREIVRSSRKALKTIFSVHYGSQRKMKLQLDHVVVFTWFLITWSMT